LGQQIHRYPFETRDPAFIKGTADAPYKEFVHDVTDSTSHGGQYSEHLQLASEPDRTHVLSMVREFAPKSARIFVGVIDPTNPDIESPETVAERVLEAAEYIEPHRLGTCDDCGFSPFADDTSTSRDTAFEKIRARVLGTELAAQKLGL